MQKAGPAFPPEAVNLFSVNCQVSPEPVPSLDKSWKVNEKIHREMSCWFEKGDG